jgi:hypothetical protein
VCPWYAVGREMSNNNLEQWINVRFCVKLSKSASEMLALFTLAYCEYAMNEWSLPNGIGSSRKGEKMGKMNQEMGSQNHKRLM